MFFFYHLDALKTHWAVLWWAAGNEESSCTGVGATQS